MAAQSLPQFDHEVGLNERLSLDRSKQVAGVGSSGGDVVKTRRYRANRISRATHIDICTLFRTGHTWKHPDGSSEPTAGRHG